MLRIVITDTETNKTMLDTFATCICAGMSIQEGESHSFFRSKSSGIKLMEMVQCMAAAEKSIKTSIKKNKCRKEYWLAKLLQKSVEEGK